MRESHPPTARPTRRPNLHIVALCTDAHLDMGLAARLLRTILTAEDLVSGRCTHPEPGKASLAGLGSAVARRGWDGPAGLPGGPRTITPEATSLLCPTSLFRPPHPLSAALVAHLKDRVAEWCKATAVLHGAPLEEASTTTAPEDSVGGGHGAEVAKRAPSRDRAGRSTSVSKRLDAAHRQRGPAGDAESAGNPPVDAEKRRRYLDQHLPLCELIYVSTQAWEGDGEGRRHGKAAGVGMESSGLSVSPSLASSASKESTRSPVLFVYGLRDPEATGLPAEDGTVSEPDLPSALWRTIDPVLPPDVEELTVVWAMDDARMLRVFHQSSPTPGEVYVPLPAAAKDRAREVLGTDAETSVEEDPVTRLMDESRRPRLELRAVLYLGEAASATGTSAAGASASATAESRPSASGRRGGGSRGRLAGAAKGARRKRAGSHSSDGSRSSSRGPRSSRAGPPRASTSVAGDAQSFFLQDPGVDSHAEFYHCTSFASFIEKERAMRRQRQQLLERQGHYRLPVAFASSSLALLPGWVDDLHEGNGTLAESAGGPTALPGAAGETGEIPPEEGAGGEPTLSSASTGDGYSPFEAQLSDQLAAPPTLGALAMGLQRLAYERAQKNAAAAPTTMTTTATAAAAGAGRPIAPWESPPVGRLATAPPAAVGLVLQVGVTRLEEAEGWAVCAALLAPAVVEVAALVAPYDAWRGARPVIGLPLALPEAARLHRRGETAVWGGRGGARGVSAAALRGASGGVDAAALAVYAAEKNVLGPFTCGTAVQGLITQATLNVARQQPLRLVCPASRTRLLGSLTHALAPWGASAAPVSPSPRHRPEEEAPSSAATAAARMGIRVVYTTEAARFAHEDGAASSGLAFRPYAAELLARTGDQHGTCSVTHDLHRTVGHRSGTMSPVAAVPAASAAAPPPARPPPSRGKSRRTGGRRPLSAAAAEAPRAPSLSEAVDPPATGPVEEEATLALPSDHCLGRPGPRVAPEAVRWLVQQYVRKALGAFAYAPLGGEVRDAPPTSAASETEETARAIAHMRRLHGGQLGGLTLAEADGLRRRLLGEAVEQLARALRPTTVRRPWVATAEGTLQFDPVEVYRLLQPPPTVDGDALQSFVEHSWSAREREHALLQAVLRCLAEAAGLPTPHGTASSPPAAAALGEPPARSWEECLTPLVADRRLVAYVSRLGHHLCTVVAGQAVYHRPIAGGPGCEAYARFTAMDLPRAENVYPPHRVDTVRMAGLVVPPQRHRRLLWVYTVRGIPSLECFTEWRRWIALCTEDEALQALKTTGTGVTTPSAPTHRATSVEVSGHGPGGEAAPRRCRGKSGTEAEPEGEDLRCLRMGLPAHTVREVLRCQLRQRSCFLVPQLLLPTTTGTAEEEGLWETESHRSLSDVPRTTAAAAASLSSSPPPAPRDVPRSEHPAALRLRPDVTRFSMESHQVLYPYTDAIVEVRTTNYSRICRYTKAHEVVATLHYNIPPPPLSTTTATSATTTTGEPSRRRRGETEGSSATIVEGVPPPSIPRGRAEGAEEEAIYAVVRFDDGLTMTCTLDPSPTPPGEIPAPPSAAESASPPPAVEIVGGRAPRSRRQSSSAASGHRRVRLGSSGGRRRRPMGDLGSIKGGTLTAADLALPPPALRLPPMGPSGSVRLWPVVSSTLDEAAFTAAARQRPARTVRPMSITLTSTNSLFHTQAEDAVVWLSYRPTDGGGGAGWAASQRPMVPLTGVHRDEGGASVVRTSHEWETRRAVDGRTGVVVRYFDGGHVQVLFPNGGVLTRYRQPPVSLPAGEPTPETVSIPTFSVTSTEPNHSPCPSTTTRPRRLGALEDVFCDTLTLPRGSRYVRTVCLTGSERTAMRWGDSIHSESPGASPFVPLQASVGGVLSSEEVYDACHRCLATSRADGVCTAVYYHEGEAGRAARFGAAAQGGPERAPGLYARVTVHADGTTIATLESDETRGGASPALRPLLDDAAAAGAACGARVRYCVESPALPRLFLPGGGGGGEGAAAGEPPGPPDPRPYYALFGDGTALRRAVEVRDVGGVPVAGVETVLHRPLGTAVRVVHEDGLVMVAAADVLARHRTARVPVALGQGVALLDVAQGGFRLVDEAYGVSEVAGLYARGDPVARVVPGTAATLLRAMVRETYAAHRLPRAQAAAQRAEEAAAVAAETRARAGGRCPPLALRLRRLAEPYILAHGLLHRGRPGETGGGPLWGLGSGPSPLPGAAAAADVEAEVSPPTAVAPLLQTTHATGAVVQHVEAPAWAHACRAAAAQPCPVFLEQHTTAGESDMQQATMLRLGPAADVLGPAAPARLDTFGCGTTWEAWGAGPSEAALAPPRGLTAPASGSSRWLPPALQPPRRFLAYGAAAPAPAPPVESEPWRVFRCFTEPSPGVVEVLLRDALARQQERQDFLRTHHALAVSQEEMPSEKLKVQGHLWDMLRKMTGDTQEGGAQQGTKV